MVLKAEKIAVTFAAKRIFYFFEKQKNKKKLSNSNSSTGIRNLSSQNALTFAAETKRSCSRFGF